MLMMIAVVGLFVTGGRDSPGFAICSGVAISLFTYFLVVWLPNHRRRIRIKQNLAKQYDVFKEECISIFFSAMQKGYSLDEREKLKQQAEFIRFFKEEVSDSQNRWHVVLNGMNQRNVENLIIEIEILVDEIRYALYVIDIDKDEVFQFLKRLSKTAYRYRNFNVDYDDLEALSGFMWSIHTGWSMIDGYTDRDIIAEMIDEI